MRSRRRREPFASVAIQVFCASLRGTVTAHAESETSNVRDHLQKESLLRTSPPAIVPKARQMSPLIELLDEPHAAVAEQGVTPPG